MNKWTFLLILVVLGIFAAIFWIPIPYYSSSIHPHATNIEVRAAIDIGSGATNLKVANVNRDTDKIVSQIFEQSIPVPYQKHLEKSSNNTFDNEVMEQGIQAIKALKEKADSYHVKKVVAVATAAFRKADNASQFAQEIEKLTGVRVHIIDQDEEGILAFRGALAITPIEANQTLVWDIGGGSMQLTTLTDAGSYLVEKGKLASIPFKNAIIQEIKHQDIQKVHSPNPLSPEEMQQALQYAEQKARETDPYIKEKIINPNTKILAVGSLFKYAIRPLINDQSTLLPGDLEKAVQGFANKTDSDLPGGALAEVAVSNPLLVLGYMKGLDIKEVEIISVNNADGALTYPVYWAD
ncbi:MAG: hypothetical protein H0W88_00390 [Parachlamydiaceae bacterium]|nr:hypothetical protein [Parachlamydiaceae bacterium]